MRLSSSAPVRTVPAGVSAMFLPWKLRVKGLLSALIAEAARVPTKASAGFVGQAETDHQLSNCRTVSKSVPATTTGEPLVVWATTYAKGTARPRPDTKD